MVRKQYPYCWSPILLLAAITAIGWLPLPHRTIATWAQPLVVWPISGSSIPDLPQSSGYGPRLQVSQGSRYDYHQGFDIPTPIGTSVVAIMSGTVRIAGSHPSYSDGVVQIDHGNNLYSNYLHIGSSLVAVDQQVQAGQAIALSGAGESGFPHLHFEIRKGSFLRADTINPLHYLPYQDTVQHTVAISEVLPTHAVWVRVTAPAQELDFNRLMLTVRTLNTHELIDSHTIDYEARNKQYGGDPALLDRADLDGVLIRPQPFTSASTLYVVDFQFHDLVGTGAIQIEACASDVKANNVCTTANGTFWTTIQLPLINR